MVDCELHAPPKIFVSDGPEGSIVGDWVAERGGVGGVVGGAREDMKVDCLGCVSFAMYTKVRS